MLRRAQIEQGDKRKALWIKHFGDRPYDEEKDRRKELLPRYHNPEEEERKRQEEEETKKKRNEKRRKGFQLSKLSSVFGSIYSKKDSDPNRLSEK